jgi:hypothetical protein
MINGEQNEFVTLLGLFLFLDVKLDGELARAF